MRQISSKARQLGKVAKLQAPTPNNLVCINIWSPGYREPIVSQSGEIKISSRFIKTDDYMVLPS